MRRALVALALLAAVAACDPGTRSVGVEFYNLKYSLSQSPDGGVLVTGTTDLPPGTPIYAVLTSASRVQQAVDDAVMLGSTDSPGSSAPAVPRHPGDPTPFRILIRTVVANTCHLVPPCGPFPAGTYHLLLDVKNPPDTAGGPSALEDPHYVTHTHGLDGFAGLELWRAVSLNPIPLYLDRTGTVRLEASR